MRVEARDELMKERSPLLVVEDLKTYFFTRRGITKAVDGVSFTLHAMRRDVVDFNKDDATPTNTGLVIVALDVARFSRVDEFKGRVDAVIRDLRTSRRLPGVERVRLPGERSHATFLERSREGVPLNDTLLAQLARLAVLGIAPLG